MSDLLDTLDPEVLSALLDVLAKDAPAATIRPAQARAVGGVVDQSHLDPLASPAAFAARWSDQTSYRMIPYRHTVCISDQLVAGIERDEWDILVVTTPPRHGKSLLISVWTPAWFLAKYHQWVGLATYEADFARSWGRKCREVIRQIGRHYDLSIKTDSKAADLWELHGYDAGMWTAGVGGPCTGKGIMLGICDDPVKNMEDAQSEDKRVKNWEWWTTTFFSRRNSDKAKLVLLETRWHEDDLGGKVLDQGTDEEAARDLEADYTGARIRHLNMPALCEDELTDPLHRKVGEALCPERFDEKALAKIQRAIGARAWTALYQQAPSIAGGNVFKRSSFVYFRTTSAEGRRAHVNLKSGEVAPVDECFRVGIMDTAFTRTTRSDYTVLGIFDVLPIEGGSLALVDGRRERVESDEHLELIKWARDVHKVLWVGVEKINATLNLFTEAKRAGLVVREIVVEGNKFSRAEVASAVLQQGRIWFPNDRPWITRWENELLGFPNGRYDDVTDVIGYAALMLAKGELRARHHAKAELPKGARNVEKIVRRQRRRHTNDMLGRGWRT